MNLRGEPSRSRAGSPGDAGTLGATSRGILPSPRRIPDWTERVREATGGAGPDVVFDGVGGTIGRAAFGITARGERFSVPGASSAEPTVVDP